MDAAESAYVPMTELQERAGAFIAGLVGVPAAYVTSGAGSALTLATAALMAGDDDDKIQQLPDTDGMKDEILIQRRGRYWYDRCLELAGARLVEFGSPDGATADDLARAIGPKTAAVHCLVQEELPDPAALPLEEVLRVAGEAGVPVTVDAAGQIYPLENIGKYVRMGAAFQCVATKYIGAPQSTGLALGTEEMIRKLSLQTFASYEGRRVRGVGAPAEGGPPRGAGRRRGGEALDVPESRRPPRRGRAAAPPAPSSTASRGCRAWTRRSSTTLSATTPSASASAPTPA